MNPLNCVCLLFFVLGNSVLHVDAGLLDSVLGIGVNTNGPANSRANENRNNFKSNPNYNQNVNNGFRFNNGNNNNENGNGNVRYNLESSGQSGMNTQRGNLNKGNLGNLELTESEKIAAQKFPELQKLLEKLKEMNKQKELEKQNNLNKPTPAPSSNNNNGQTAVTKNPLDKGDGKDKNGWKMLKKKKFFFQAKPVRPENEVVDKEEVMYYID